MSKFFIQKVNEGKNIPLPKYKTEFSSGLDLHAAIQNPIFLKSRDFKLIPAGIKIKIPKDYEAQIRPRSGLALNYGITVLNSPGTVDSDFRGEIKIIILNNGVKTFKILPKMRIAQLVFSPIIRPILEEKNFEAFETKRNEMGFGSTGEI